MCQLLFIFHDSESDPKYLQGKFSKLPHDFGEKDVRN